MTDGSCLCGAVAYRITGEMRPSVACHCTQCRKTSGHYWSATQVATGQLTLIRDEGLTWYQSSPTARRGFCRICGASLFWECAGEGRVSIGSGTLDDDAGLRQSGHIFVGDKGGYYDIADGLPQRDAG